MLHNGAFGNASDVEFQCVPLERRRQLNHLQDLQTLEFRCRGSRTGGYRALSLT